MEGWQPIETAPKDPNGKERLLGFHPEHGIKMMRYDGWGAGSGSFEILSEDNDYDDGHVWEEFQATHWMPLPAPPESTQP